MGYLTLAFPEAPSGWNRKITPAFFEVPTKWDKVRIGHAHTFAFSRAHKWAELLHEAFMGSHRWTEVLRKPCILRGPQQRGQNQDGLPHPCLPRGAEVAGIAASPQHSQGSPTKGTKLELATSYICLFEGPKVGGIAK